VPIFINPPIDNLFVGPGTEIHVTTDNPGSFPGAWWDLEIRKTLTEDILGQGSNRLNVQPASLLYPNVDILASAAYVAGFRQVQPAAAQPAQSAQATIRFRDPTSVIEQTSTPVQWLPDPVGVAWVQQLAAVSTTGGFTATDRASLQLVEASVVSSLPLTTPATGLADLGLDLLQRGPPTEFLGVDADLFLTGRGSVNRPSGDTGIYAYGARWELFNAPPGLGKLEGVVTRYEQRIVQFALIKGGAGGFEYIDQLEDHHTGSGQMTWAIPFPKRLEFSILPGCTLRFRWLLFLIAPTTPV
jgi:hypothetical protein